MICLLVCSSTACISSHLFVVVPVAIPVLDIVPVNAPVELAEPVDSVETPCPGVVEPLDNPLCVVPEVNVPPVTPVAVVVVDAKTVVPKTFRKVQRTNIY